MLFLLRRRRRIINISQLARLQQPSLPPPSPRRLIIIVS
jgi:hypothetical protein